MGGQGLLDMGAWEGPGGAAVRPEPVSDCHGASEGVRGRPRVTIMGDRSARMSDHHRGGKCSH